MRTTQTQDVLGALRYDDERYHSGFGQRSVRRWEGRRLGVEWATDADGVANVVLYRPEDLAEARRNSIQAGGGTLGMMTYHMPPDAPRVVLTGEQAEGLSVAEAEARLGL